APALDHLNRLLRGAERPRGFDDEVGAPAVSRASNRLDRLFNINVDDAIRAEPCAELEPPAARADEHDRARAERLAPLNRHHPNPYTPHPPQPQPPPPLPRPRPRRRRPTHTGLSRPS